MTSSIDLGPQACQRGFQFGAQARDFDVDGFAQGNSQAAAVAAYSKRAATPIGSGRSAAQWQALHLHARRGVIARRRSRRPSNMPSQQPSDTTKLDWHGSRLCVRLPERARVALELDGAWFDDLAADADGMLSLTFPFAPNGRDAFDVVVRDQRDGVELARLSVASRRRLQPPREGEWLLPIDAQPMRPEVAIVIPIFNAPGSVARCLASVLAHSAGATRLILIDDASSDAQIAPLLEPFLNRAGIEVLRNTHNRGFTATVNRGIAHAERADVVLLNADTVVGPNWLTGLRRAAYTRADIATATAVSDNAGAFSVPELERENDWPSNWNVVEAARALWQDAGLAYPQLPTGNGFCMYIRRNVFDAIGLFDEQAFAQGYGEENDFCQRASAHGLRHVIVGNVFVHHERSMSFGIERRESLGRTGMQVLRERWPNYEADVGATLFSFERRVLDWRVRRLYAMASMRSIRPRVLRVGAMDAPANGEFDVWHAREHGDRCALHDAHGDTVDAQSPTAAVAPELARLLQSHAIELLDVRCAGDSNLVAHWTEQARRIGVAVVERHEHGLEDSTVYRAAIRSQATFGEMSA
ncbi:MAG: glycosyltransferase [Dokdonella sp.]